MSYLGIVICSRELKIEAPFIFTFLSFFLFIHIFIATEPKMNFQNGLIWMNLNNDVIVLKKSFDLPYGKCNDYRKFFNFTRPLEMTEAVRSYRGTAGLHRILRN